MAIVQIRHDSEGRAYFRRRTAGGKTPMEALRALKRRLSDVVYRQLVTDMKKASPAGHTEATTTSSAANPTPTVSSSEQSQPELAPDPTLPHGYHDTADVHDPSEPHPAPHPPHQPTQRTPTSHTSGQSRRPRTARRRPKAVTGHRGEPDVSVNDDELCQVPEGVGDLGREPQTVRPRVRLIVAGRAVACRMQH